ncbi:MAG: cytochrome c3 family protein [Planctomycetota bacterium]
MQDLQNKFIKVLLLVLSMAVFVLLAYAAYQENFGVDWYRYQSEYKQQLVTRASTEREREAAERFDVGQKQLYLPHLNSIDRCLTCHIAIDNPSMKDAPQPLTAHSGQIMQDHPKEQFGCTICHAGQGRAVTEADAHGHVAHWPRPMPALKELDRSCPKCHTERALPGVDRYNAAMDLFYEHGCLSCHRLRSRGGDIGPDISNAGGIHDAEWHFKHFKDPKSVVATSEMTNENFSDEQARLLAFLMMSYTGDSIPTELLSNATSQTAQMKLPEPLEPLALEGLVGSQFCIACHGATHPATVQTWRDSKMASTYERIRNEQAKDNCLPCHTTGLNPETGHYLEEGVGCEACHGPGREAVRLVLAGKTTEHKTMIKIDRKAVSVCERCHNPHVATESHVEFYRKLPRPMAAPTTIRPVAKEEFPAAMEMQPALPTKPVAREEPAAAEEPQRPAPAKDMQPVAKEESVVANQQDEITHAKPESAVIARPQAVQAPRPQPAATEASVEPDSTALAEPEQHPATESWSITAQEPEARQRDVSLTRALPDSLIPEVVALPQFDILSGTMTAKPPEKIEGGCVSTECHAATVFGEVLHGPTAQQDCEFCHQLVDEPNHKFKLPLAEPKLCFECHDSPAAHEFQHGPVSLGVCTVCHNPHSGPNKFMLPETGNKLCFGCHTDMHEHVENVMTQHDVIREEGCIACHDPHASDFNHQLKQDTLDLCLGCHEPIGEIVENALVSHGAVTEDNKCANCHSPHGSDMPDMLVDEEINLCLDCHDEPMDTPRGPIINMKTWIESNPERHGPIREGNCTLCHQPHGSEHFRILAHEFPHTFYSPFSVEAYDLCFQCHEDTLVLDELTTALTDFRNGEKNLHFVHVNQKRGRTCRACHEVHAGTKPKRMKDFVPYGTWNYPIGFELSTNGGKCAPGCHVPRTYDRKQAVIQQ